MLTVCLESGKKSTTVIVGADVVVAQVSTLTCWLHAVFKAVPNLKLWQKSVVLPLIVSEPLLVTPPSTFRDIKHENNLTVTICRHQAGNLSYEILPVLRIV